MADSLMADCTREPPPPDPEDRVRTLLQRLRSALLSHRDGARMATEEYSPVEPNTLALTEAMHHALLETGRDPRDAAWTSWTLVYFALGLVQEWQSSPSRMPGFHAEVFDPSDFPALSRTLPHLRE
ncbi:TetR/AcrR family transcriptional regulator C-terminal domain-containing protein [Streptomyces phaeochromogenes]|uniref:TetR/AcrR family transcriptional regulator C-terminal domain-containing protein n=1 Tax=Streptomyces phaeochromogenes TaxID=1923 RepID=UPI002DD97A41|nr:TetR/AcrR family transcriptional regulator C-terminal domain-containing protein [Streptomyces phaeochromogenes]WRZ34496.1 TetR/AcrR family transcriptional regulator C-terminal domain-containing protein [Streptomyces phaeochromogenes]